MIFSPRLGALGRGDELFRPGLGRWGGAMRFSPRLGALGRGDEIFRPAGRGGAMHWLRTTTLFNTKIFETFLVKKIYK